MTKKDKISLALGTIGFVALLAFLSLSHQPKIRYCPNCGERAKTEQAKYCTKCGEKL